MAWFRNFYACPKCRTAWDDEWSAMSDDTCPVCACTDIEPASSADLSVVINKNPQGDYDLLVSGDEAHEYPMYRKVMIISSETVQVAAKTRQSGP